MRILAFCNSPSTARGGAEASFETIADGLAQRGHEVVRLYNERGPDAPGVYRRALPWLSMRGAWPTPRGVRTLLRHLLPLARLLRARRPDVVLVHFVDLSALYFVLLKKVFGYRLVLNARGSDLLVQPTRSERHARLLPFVLRHADHVVAPASTMLEAAAVLAPEVQARAVLIPNGIDYAFWSSAPADRVEAGLIVAAGRLHPVKGFDVLVEAFARVNRQHPEARLCIYGEGEQRPHLEARVAALGLGDAVSLPGWASREQLRDAYARAAVVAVPSRSEGFGNVAAEALATGAPVVASAVGGLPHVVHDPAYLVAPQDPTALAAKLALIFEQSQAQPDIRAASRARARAFTWSAALARYETVLQGNGQRGSASPT